MGTAVAGAHHALHSMLAFDPAISVTTIDRTVARSTGRSSTRGQDPRQLFKGINPLINALSRRRQVRDDAEIRETVPKNPRYSFRSGEQALRPANRLRQSAPI